MTQPRVRKTAKKKTAGERVGTPKVLHGLFRSFASLAGQAAEGRPLLRGMRVAYDPSADRFVVVHLDARVEFVLSIHADGVPPDAEVECRRMSSSGTTEETPLARFRFNDAGVVTESTVTDLIGERVGESNGAWTIVAAVTWSAMQG